MIYTIPYEYTIIGELKVEANSLKEAVEAATDHIMSSDCNAENEEYLDGSFCINDNLVKELNNDTSNSD